MSNNSPFLSRPAANTFLHRLIVGGLLGCAALIPSWAADTTVAWGNNNNLQCQVPAGLTGVSTLAGGAIHSLALKADGAVVGWGDNTFGEVNVSDLANAVAVAAGENYSLILLNNGTVVVRGDQLAAPSGLTTVTAIAAGWNHCLALKQNGTVVSWGDTNSVPADLNNVVAIAAGDGNSLALLDNGQVVAWGDPSFGKTTVPAGLSNVVAIAAGKDHCVALQLNGNVVAWGSDSDGQATVPAGLSNVVAVTAGALHTVALKADGSLVAWGSNVFGQQSVPSWSNFMKIAAGGYHNLGLLGDGSPAFQLQPRSQSVPIGRTVTLTVLAAGVQPITYQWQRNGTNLVGKTGPVLVLSNIQLSDAGSYSVNAANGIGTTASAAAIITPVLLPPVILVQPQDATNNCGDVATLTIAADGTKPLSYQWWFEGTTLAGRTNAALVFTNVTTAQDGSYSVVITNSQGSITSAVATLTVLADPPVITSPLTASGVQGQPFTYTITATRSPMLLTASELPLGLSVSTNGVISGTPLQSGTFTPIITAVNECASQSETLMLTFSSSAPVITSGLTVAGREDQFLTYQIRASGSPTSFGAQQLPAGLSVDPGTGLVFGSPVFAGNYTATILASNVWGTGTATLSFTITNKLISGLSIANVTYTYSTPYLLDFQFSLRSNEDPSLGDAVVVPPQSLYAIGLEDGNTNSPSESGVRIALGSTKQLKANLVLDFTESLASLSNGDLNGDGISDAIEEMVHGAQTFVNQQAASAQMGVFEFHREDLSPQKVQGLTTDKALLDSAIAGIWTNYVKGFPASSRCWDALTMAITDLGTSNRDEQHIVVFISDGLDESSTSTVASVITAATNSGVRVICIGFGDQIDTANLTTITTETRGIYYEATNAIDLGDKFGQISKDLMGQYILRWATLKRTSSSFMPSFEIYYGTNHAVAPTNPVSTDYNNPIIDTNAVPPTTNYPLVTNFIIAPYIPTQHTGTVTLGALRLSADAAVKPSAITLRAAYVPRYIRQLRINYRANWPCTTSLMSTGPGEILSGWSLTETNDDTGGTWLSLSSPNPESVTNSLPFASFGNLIHFNFNDVINSSNAFSYLTVDNTLYTNTGGQAFVIENTNAFVAAYPVLPYQTPVPWLISHGITSNFTNAETADPDGDGVPTWQEYRANTDPNSSASTFAVRGLSNDVFGRSEVTFSSALNRLYRVETSSDLVNWDTVEADVPGTGADVTVLDQRYIPWVPQVFYRVLVY
jgi:alpha-tubulin suppressor-like RCC1 family protein